MPPPYRNEISYQFNKSDLDSNYSTIEKMKSDLMRVEASQFDVPIVLESRNVNLNLIQPVKNSQSTKKTKK